MKDGTIKNVVIKVPAFEIKANVYVSTANKEDMLRAEIDIFKNNIQETLDKVVAKAIKKALKKEGAQLGKLACPIGAWTAAFPTSFRFEIDLTPNSIKIIKGL